MIKLLRFTEYLYLIVAIVSIYKIGDLWETDREGTYIFIFFAIVSIGMFIFRRTYRRRFEKRKKENKS
jgi:positive regulator of sigma E activity